MLVLLVFLGQPFGLETHAPLGTGVKSFEHGQHLGAEAVAPVAAIVVAGVQPDRQAPAMADAGRVVAAEVQQGPYQLGAAAWVVMQGAAGSQAGQAAAMTAAGQVEQHRFGPVRGGVTGDDMAYAPQRSQFGQAPVAPLARLVFAGGRRLGPFEHQGQPLAGGPGGQLLGLAARFGAPAVVPMPKGQGPAVQAAQVRQQPRHRHRILPAGNTQQQGDPGGQQAGLAAQVTMQPQVIGAPSRRLIGGAGGGHGLGWENQT